MGDAGRGCVEEVSDGLITHGAPLISHFRGPVNNTVDFSIKRLQVFIFDKNSGYYYKVRHKKKNSVENLMPKVVQCASHKVVH